MSINIWIDNLTIFLTLFTKNLFSIFPKQLLHEIYAIWERFHFYAIWELCHLRRNQLQRYYEKRWRRSGNIFVGILSTM